MAARIAPVQILRRITLGIVLVGMTTLTILHQKLQGIPTVDALDPFGGLETLLKFVAGGEIIKKLEPGTIVLFGGTVVLGIVLARFFCGWFCAFGALQGLFGWLGRKIFRRRFAVPAKLDAVLRWAKYPLLVAVIYFTWRAGDLVIRPYDPLEAYGHLSAGFAAIWAEFAVGFALLVATMLLSMLYERAFCKYLCPLGAVTAILSRVPPLPHQAGRVHLHLLLCLRSRLSDEHTGFRSGPGRLPQMRLLHGVRHLLPHEEEQPHHDPGR